MSSLWLRNFRRNVYSQNGEDGVIEMIFEKIGTVNKWSCEFGAHDGISFSNTANLILHKNWRSVLIESDENRFQEMVKNLHTFIFLDWVFPIHRTVGFDPNSSDTLDEILESTKIPENFDLLSIDVDGADCLIWETVKGYKPRVVIVEVDSTCAPDTYAISTLGAATIDQAVELGKSKGYELALHTGNAIFVLREYCEALNIDPNNWQELFDRSWIHV
jgi:hypothetical protein